MLDTESTPKIAKFFGLHNVTDSLRVGAQWLSTANNVNITDTGAIEKREGYALATAFEIEGYEGDIPVFFIPGTGAFTSIYCTLDAQRGYFVAGNKLYAFTGVPSLAPVLSSDPALATLTAPSAEMFWAEINDQVFYNNGTDSGIILPDNTVLTWAIATPDEPTLSAITGTLAAGTYQVRCTFVTADGRESGASDPVDIAMNGDQAFHITSIPHQSGSVTRVYISPANSEVYQLAFTTTGSAASWNFSNDALGQDLRNEFLQPLPSSTTAIQFFKGRAYVAQYLPSTGQTVVWFSQSLGFHLFNTSADFFIVPGQVHMLAPTSEALIVGTDTQIFAYSVGLTEIAPYGVVPGQHWADDETRILFWSTRGVCGALPFSNLTERQVSVAPGVRAGGAIVRSGGQTRYVVSLQQGGEAFNAY